MENSGLSAGDLWLYAAAIFALLFLSGFFSGSETALTAVKKGWLHQKEAEGSKSAGIVNRLREKKERLIGAILLGNNLVNILASALATSALIQVFGDGGVVYATLVMTLMVLIFSEVLPKTYAINNAEKAALFVAPIIRVVVWVLAPFTNIIAHIVDLMLKPFSKKGGEDGDAVKVQALRGLIELHQADIGAGEDAEEDVRQERIMLRSILDLADVDVHEITTHRSKMVVVDADLPTEEIVDQVLESPFTRIPLYKDSPDNIVGVLHAKALLRELRQIGEGHMSDGEIRQIDILELAADPWFIPETTSLLDQLQEFRERHEHFALVVDEYGALMGLLTLEDILEEIVGDIIDEQDIPITGVIPQGDGSYIIDGSVTIRDLNREYDWKLPDEDYATIAGLVLFESRKIPRIGEVYRFYNHQFEIKKRHKNQITLLKVTPIK